ncbi:MAG: hypothetical protein ACM3UU_09480 [Ignavibacteriales bacterium]
MFPYSMYYFSEDQYYPIDAMSEQNLYGDVRGYDDDMGLEISRMPDDPPPILTNNPVTTAIALRKELTGYPNYGNPSGNADILYTGNQGAWTFALPAFLSAALVRFRRVELVIRGALDDHYNVPVSSYRMTVNVNGIPQNIGALPFVHGSPVGQRFNNWNQLIIPISPINVRRNNRVVIRNTSTAGLNDFIAFDWMEMRFYL